MGQILDIMNGIQQGVDDGRKQGLSRLVGKAYAADPAEQQRLLGLVAQRGEPGMAMEAQKGFDDQSAELHKQLAQRAGMVVSLYKANPQMAQQAYAAMLPLAARAGFPQAQAHPQLDDSLIPGLEKLASALQTGTAANVQSTYIDDKGQRVAIMRNGSVQVLGANAPNNQIIDTGNGFFGVNKGNLQAAPVMTGGAPAPQQQRAPGEVPFSIDPSLPPEVQADIRANESKYAQAPDGGGIGIGGGGGAAPMGGQLRSAPKPQAPSALQEKIATAQRMGATPDQIKQMVMGTAGKEASISGDPSDPLGGLSPADAALVQKLAHYQMLPASLGRSNNRAELMARAAMLNPDFNEANAKQAYTYLTDLSKSGPTSAGGQAASVNTAIHHLGTLMQINAKLKTGQYPMVNEATNAFKTATGSSEVTQWKQATNFVSQEIAKLVKGGVANEGEMRDILRDLNVAGSQEQRNQAISRAAEFLYGRIHAVEERGQRALGEMDPGTSLMTPEAQKILGAAYTLGGRIAPELLPAQKGGSFTRNSTTPQAGQTAPQGGDDARRRALLDKY